MFADPKSLLRLLWLAAPLCLWLGCRPNGASLLLQGEQLLRAGKAAQAIPYLNSACEMLPEHPQAWNHLGLAYHSSGQPKEALRCYQMALSKDRNLAPARFNLGALHLEEKNYPAAVNELTTFVVLQPNSAAGWLALGKAQFRTQKLDEAERSLATVHKLAGPSPETWNLLGVIQANRKKSRDALAYFQAAAKQNTNYGPAILNQALLTHLQLNNKPLALQKYKEFLGAAPGAEYSGKVRELVTQLEQELLPKPIAAPTNSPTLAVLPQVTNKPTVLAPTNVVLAASTATAPPVNGQKQETKPVAKPVSSPPTNQAAVTPPPAARSTPVEKAEPPKLPANPPPPVEVVKVEEEPAPQPAQDLQAIAEIRPARDVAAIRELNSKTDRADLEFEPKRDVETKAAPSTSATATDPKPVRKSGDEKKSVFQKMNPVTWFKRDKPAEPGPKTVDLAKVTPLEVPSRSTPASAGRSPEPTVSSRPPNRTPALNSPSEGPSEPASSWLRYTYRRPARGVSGKASGADALLRKGVEAHQQGDLPRAIAAYQQAGQLNPASYEAFYNLGLAAFQARDLPVALGAYEQAIANKPESTDALYNFALALNEANFPFEAVAELRNLVAKAPSETRAHLLAANIYSQKLRNNAAARPHYEKLLQLEPQHPLAADIRYWLATTR